MKLFYINLTHKKNFRKHAYEYKVVHLFSCENVFTVDGNLLKDFFLNDYNKYETGLKLFGV